MVLYRLQHKSCDRLSGDLLAMVGWWLTNPRPETKFLNNQSLQKVEIRAGFRKANSQGCNLYARELTLDYSRIPLG